MTSERRPQWIYGTGEEPDPRFTLANERTFLAWVRTAMAMLAGGVALHALGLPETSWVRSSLAVMLVVFGGVMTVMALVRWARVERAMRTQQPLPHFRLGYLLTIMVVIGAAVLAIAFA